MTNCYYPEFKSGIKSFVAAFKKKFENEYYFVGEMHNFWELVYVTEGSLFVSEDNRIYKLNEGDIIFHKPMEFHKIWVEKDTGIILREININNIKNRNYTFDVVQDEDFIKPDTSDCKIQE